MEIIGCAQSAESVDPFDSHIPLLLPHFQKGRALAPITFTRAIFEQDQRQNHAPGSRDAGILAIDEIASGV